MTYDVSYALEEKSTDEKIVKEGVNIYIDAAATLFLIGSEVDWSQDKPEPLIGEGPIQVPHPRRILLV